MQKYRIDAILVGGRACLILISQFDTKKLLLFLISDSDCGIQKMLDEYECQSLTSEVQVLQTGNTSREKITFLLSQPI